MRFIHEQPEVSACSPGSRHRGRRTLRFVSYETGGGDKMLK
jgi:hypothetical protein